MKKSIYATAALLAATVLLQAQNVNQTVQVTADYKSELPEFEKRSLDVAVPDTLLVFDYKFDYSVFDSPYKGAYEFSPYTVSLTPKVRNTYYNKLYVRAGAGYSFHPELDAVYELKPADNLALSVYTTGKGYAGRYSTVGTDMKADPHDCYSGHDFVNRTGVTGRANFLRSDLTFEAAYNGIFAADLLETSRYNGAHVGARLKSNGERGSYFYYDVFATYDYGHDSYRRYGGGLSENDVTLGGTVGPVLDGKYRFLVDFAVRTDFTTGMKRFHYSLFDVTPRVEFELGPVSLSAGALMNFNNQEKPFIIYPDIRAGARFFDDVLKVWAAVKGDASLASYREMKLRSHFYTMPWNVDDGGFRIERNLDAAIGASAQIGYFSARINGGYMLLRNSMAETMEPGVALDGTLGALCERYAWIDYNMAHMEAAVSWNSERLQADAELNFKYADYRGAEPDVWFPSRYSGRIAATYNWNRRIFAGLSLAGCTSRSNPSRVVPGSFPGSPSVDYVPGWLDLGLNGRYVLNQTFTFWGQAGNLLGQSVRTGLLHVQTGPYITLGVCLTL